MTICYKEGLGLQGELAIWLRTRNAAEAAPAELAASVAKAVIEEPGVATSIGIGIVSIVTLRYRPEGGEDPGYPAADEQTWEITDGPADFAEDRLAADSPLGSQIMGSHAGDKLPVTIHGNNDQVEILDVLN